MDKLIGRERERTELQRCLESNRSELVIVYGRRRVGKTFLIEEIFNQCFDFKYVGAHGMSTRRQLSNFHKVLNTYTSTRYKSFQNWDEAFHALQDYLGSLPVDRKRIVFIDEMPWMDSTRSTFLSALENFWNGWAMSQRNIMLIATGSATSWMQDKLVANKGGLHARITCNLHVAPFTLREVELYMQSRGMEWDRYQLTQAYMTVGGIPFYYSLFDPQLSFAQNVDRLFFNSDGLLRMEFDELYTALFSNSDLYIDVAELLSRHKSGLTIKDIQQLLKSKSSNLSKVLKNLERSNMIEVLPQFGNHKRGALYHLTDFYSLFYFKFLSGNYSRDENWWVNHMNSGIVYDWQGEIFELICLQHHTQIKEALGIRGVASAISAWQIKPNKSKGVSGAQIDLIIERADRIINLCEIKFCNDLYRLTPDYERHLRERSSLFKEFTKTTKTVVHTFITSYGVANARNRSIVNSQVTLDELFA